MSPTSVSPNSGEARDASPMFMQMPMLANGQQWVMASARLQAQAYRAAMRFQIEMLDFLRHRVEQDMKFIDDLSAKEDMSEAMDVVSGFMQHTASEYTSEVSKLASIGARLTSQAARDAAPQGRSRDSERAGQGRGPDSGSGRGGDTSKEGGAKAVA
ncbi:MAG: phasin family protein [Phyllobacteriaceae bacterium]|nr:phasin family protein [Phyllobacteriaceae bacterium]